MTKPELFAVSRGIFDHPVLNDGKSFTRREAWLWMIAEAAQQDQRKHTSKGVATLKRGQLARSIRYMADEWAWTSARVLRFVKLLRTEAMIETETVTGVHIITICNYDTYQCTVSATETQTDAVGVTATTRQRNRRRQ